MTCADTCSLVELQATRRQLRCTVGISSCTEEGVMPFASSKLLFQWPSVAISFDPYSIPVAARHGMLLPVLLVARPEMSQIADYSTTHAEPLYLGVYKGVAFRRRINYWHVRMCTAAASRQHDEMVLLQRHMVPRVQSVQVADGTVLTAEGSDELLAWLPSIAGRVACLLYSLHVLA